MPCNLGYLISSEMMIYFDDGTMTTVKPSIIRVREDSPVLNRRSTHLGPGTMRGPATQTWYQPPEAQSWFTAALGGVSQVGPTQRRMHPSQTMVTSAKPRYTPAGKNNNLFSPVRLVQDSRPKVRQANIPSASMSTDNLMDTLTMRKLTRKRRKRSVTAESGSVERKALKLKPGNSEFKK